MTDIRCVISALSDTFAQRGGKTVVFLLLFAPLLNPGFNNVPHLLRRSARGMLRFCSGLQNRAVFQALLR